MRRNIFKPSKSRKIQRKIITSMAGDRYLTKINEINKEINNIKKTAMNYALLDTIIWGDYYDAKCY